MLLDRYYVGQSLLEANLPSQLGCSCQKCELAKWCDDAEKHGRQAERSTLTSHVFPRRSIARDQTAIGRC